VSRSLKSLHGFKPSPSEVIDPAVLARLRARGKGQSIVELHWTRDGEERLPGGDTRVFEVIEAVSRLQKAGLVEQYERGGVIYYRPSEAKEIRNG
jgi:DNA-binding transcriptional ArsR family regulator